MDNTHSNLYIKNNDTYINIPNEILDAGKDMISDYIKVYTEIESLKSDINQYIFSKNTTVTPMHVMTKLIELKKIDSINTVLPFLNIDLLDIENRLINICITLGLDTESLTKMRDELTQNFISTEHCLENIIDENYSKSIIDSIKVENMYSLNTRSKYGTMSTEYNLRNFDDIVDFNNEEINGRYSPILVIHRPAKYHRGSYILDDNTSVYIKRQPLDALIHQEKIAEKGIDSMGAILYKKLDHNLSNENLQELLAEIYIHSQKNDLEYTNIKLSDILNNKVWMTADKLKKEFKELRYYNKNLSQKLREIYDTTGEYYTQIGGKYIFNSRNFLHSYKAYKDRDINI